MVSSVIIRPHHGKQVLLALAPLGFWLEKFPSHDGGIHTDAAVGWF